jgi:hypothetical protein
MAASVYFAQRMRRLWFAVAMQTHITLARGGSTHDRLQDLSTAASQNLSAGKKR